MLGAQVIRKQLNSSEYPNNDCSDHKDGYNSRLINSPIVRESTNSMHYQTYNESTTRCSIPKKRLLADPEPTDQSHSNTNINNKNGSHLNNTQANANPENHSQTISKPSIDILKLTLTTEHDSISTMNRYKQQSWDQKYSFPRLIHANQSDPFVLQPSLFHESNLPPTIYFATKLNDESRPPVGLPKKLQSLFKWKISSITPNTIRSCISFMKFEIVRPSNNDDKSYLGAWCKHMPTADFNNLEDWCKVNHYPGSFHMGRKDKLWARLKLANEKFESFHPTTFILPKDYPELESFWKNSPSKLFIIKPPASARGNGVKVINNISQIPEDAIQQPSISGSTATGATANKKSSIIVQQYIANPCLLENGHKFDLRIYVLLTSIDPLRVYVYDEGLVRFASSKYTNQADGIIDQYMHLTNYFVNKNNQKYQANNDTESLNGCKWSLRRFWRYLNENNKHVDTTKLWENIVDIIIKTIISCESPMFRLSHQYCKNDYTSYELFGFDIILDENFKPWILEVNITPSLKSESNLDTSVKYRVIKDMFNLVGYHLPPPDGETKAKLGGFSAQRLYFDPRLYRENLSKRDRIKHMKYQKLFRLESNPSEVPAPSSRRASSTAVDVYDGDASQLQKEKSLSSANGTANSHNSQTSQKVATLGPSAGLCSNTEQNDHSSSGDDDSCSSKNRLFSRESILSDLSQSDVRVLMLAEDELSRCGQFKRVFPSVDSSKYLKYFDKPRYYNLLLDAWEQKYHDNRLEGVKRLSSLAKFLD